MSEMPEYMFAHHLPSFSFVTGFVFAPALLESTSKEFMFSICIDASHTFKMVSLCAFHKHGMQESNVSKEITFRFSNKLFQRQM